MPKIGIGLKFNKDNIVREVKQVEKNKIKNLLAKNQ